MSEREQVKQSEPNGDDGMLAVLGHEARLLMAEMTGPLRRIHVSRGDAVLEIEWHGERPAVEPVQPGSAPPAATVDVPAGVPSVTPPGMMPPGVMPPGVMPSGVMPPGVMPSGVMRTGTVPPATGDGWKPLDGPGLHSIVSPMVGTFFRASEPGAAPFVAVGDLVEPDRVIGIVEAMKLMNEITAGRAGRVLDVLVDDGQPVEFGQVLIALAPA